MSTTKNVVYDVYIDLALCCEKVLKYRLIAIYPTADSTGQQSVYTTFNNCEIMFHVSTMLPYTPNNTQQVSLNFWNET